MAGEEERSVSANGPAGPAGPADPGGAAGNGSTVWRRATSTAYVESAERVVVLDLDHPELPPYVFEGTGAQIWACVDGDRTEDEIVADLAEAFEVPLDVVRPDVRGFVDRLRALGLVVAAISS